MNDLDSLRLLTLDQAATILQISKRTLLRMIEKDRFPAFKIGHQWRIRPANFQAWLEKDR